jgi:hypothetical protein
MRYSGRMKRGASGPSAFSISLRFLVYVWFIAPSKVMDTGFLVARKLENSAGLSGLLFRKEGRGLQQQMGSFLFFERLISGKVDGFRVITFLNGYRR